MYVLLISLISYLQVPTHLLSIFTGPQQIMNLLELVEYYIGQIDDWPSHILIDLFTVHSSWVKAAFNRTLKEITAFFYGNCLPVDLACQFFQACNGTSSDVNLMIRRYYRKWQRS
jgi:hypothetical protein